MNERNRGGRPPVDSRAKAAWACYRYLKPLGPLARQLGVSVPAVSQWPHVPADRLEVVAHYLDVLPAQLRPDLFPAPETPAPWDDLITNVTKQT